MFVCRWRCSVGTRRLVYSYFLLHHSTPGTEPTIPLPLYLPFPFFFPGMSDPWPFPPPQLAGQQPRSKSPARPYESFKKKPLSPTALSTAERDQGLDNGMAFAASPAPGARFRASTPPRPYHSLKKSTLNKQPNPSTQTNMLPGIPSNPNATSAGILDLGLILIGSFASPPTHTHVACRAPLSAPMRRLLIRACDPTGSPLQAMPAVAADLTAVKRSRHRKRMIATENCGWTMRGTD